MKFKRINRDRLDDSIEHLNADLEQKIVVGAKINLIGLFHNLLDLSNNSLILTASHKDEVHIKILNTNQLFSESILKLFEKSSSLDLSEKYFRR